MRKLFLVLITPALIISCNNASAPSLPPKPITVLTSVTPKSTEVSGTLGEYLKIVDAASDVEGNDREYSITLTVEAIKPTGPINSGGWKCAEMSLTLLNEKGMPISGLSPATSFDGLNELHNILVAGSGQAFIKFEDYETKADSLIKNFAKSFVISGQPLRDHIEQNQGIEKETTTSDDAISTQTEEAKDEPIETESSTNNSSIIKELVDQYCEWSEKEADAKDRDDIAAARAADDKVDEARNKALKLPAADLQKFRELTKNCKDHH